jgi:hypothetical protein
LLSLPKIGRCKFYKYHIINYLQNNDLKRAKVMKETGIDLPSLYKETAEGGLARFAKKR